MLSLHRSRQAVSRILGLLLGLLLLLQSAPAAAFDGLRWTWIDPLPTGAGLFAVTYGNGLFVAVGEAETILTSTDGRNWTVRSTNYSANTFDVVDVIWGGGQFVALGRVIGNAEHPEYGMGPAELFMPITSPDGITWTVHRDQAGFAVFPTAIFETLHRTWGKLGYDGTQYVLRVWRAVRIGGDYDFYVSADGVHWRPAPNYRPEDFPGYHPTAPGEVLRGNGMWVSIGESASLNRPMGIWTSEDGVDWTYRVPIPALVDITFGNGLFVGVGTGGASDRHGFIITSTDGLNWKTEGSAFSRTGETAYRAAAHGNGVTVVGGDQKVVVLDAALRPTVVPLAETVMDVAFVKGQFVLAAQDRDCKIARIYTSQDGLNWTVRHEFQQECVSRILQAGDEVAVWSTNSLHFSHDLVQWESRPHGLRQGLLLRDLTWGNGQFVLIDRWNASGPIAFSTDGTNWTPHNPHYEDSFHFITYANGLFVISGEEHIYTSRDGLYWTRHPGELGGYIRNLYYLDGQYVGVGGRSLFFSADGQHWRIERALGQPQLYDVVSTGTHWILVGDNRILAAEIPSCRPYFTDIPSSHPSCKAVETLYRYGVISGYGDGSFRPDNRVTRAEIAKMVTVALREQPNPLGKVTFRDVSNHWAYAQGYLQTAVEMGIISGYNAQTFGPNDPLTRAQLIKIAAAALGLKESTGSTSYTGVPSWATGWVAAAEQAGLIGSRAPHPIWTGGNLNGDAPVTRAEAATVLANLLALKK
ncbi:MAG: S-layer homology domain-containing protein [Symbiobacterium sp.]|uniref:S-layer homology domain-containing protein n=1 Tax=Symbiobacterium sp. TaxID=1971213 RepID=UPI0034647C15